MNVFPPGSIASANITFQTGFEGPRCDGGGAAGSFHQDVA